MKTNMKWIIGIVVITTILTVVSVKMFPTIVYWYVCWKYGDMVVGGCPLI